MSLKEKALAGLTSIPDPDHGYGRYQVPDDLVPEPSEQRDTARWSA